ncbi:MAG: hypothetical protein JO250_14280 [Armatimonadetes bacterium]|nr:hypothetical protein [Armatimonadota bacterium]
MPRTRRATAPPALAAPLGLTLALAAPLGLTLAAAPARAQTTVFSTFGPSNTFITVAGYPETSSVSVGAAFTPSASGSLFSITVAASNLNGANDAHFYLTDSSASLGKPSAALDSFTFNNLPAAGTPFTPEVGLSSAHPTLTAGTTYYLYEQETGSENNVFNVNSTGATGTVVQSNNGGKSYTGSTGLLPAFSIQINAAAAPEPCAGAVLGGLCALTGLTLLRRARRRPARRKATP